jgi:hypothetical protein
MQNLCLALTFIVIVLAAASSSSTEHDKSYFYRTLSGIHVSLDWMAMLVGIKTASQPVPRTFRILVAGLGRTDSISLAEALKILGFSTILHDDEMPNVADLVGDYYRSRDITVGQLHEGFGPCPSLTALWTLGSFRPTQPVCVE